MVTGDQPSPAGPAVTGTAEAPSQQGRDPVELREERQAPPLWPVRPRGVQRPWILKNEKSPQPKGGKGCSQV